MKASKLFIAGALAITSLSFASCSQDEPAAQTAQTSAAITRADNSEYKWVGIPGFSYIRSNDDSNEMNVLKYHIDEVNAFLAATNVITTGDDLGNSSYDRDIFSATKGSFLIVVNATGDQIYNWMNKQSWPDGFNKCPDSYKGGDVKFAYTLISNRGFEGSYPYNIDPLEHSATVIYDLMQ